MVKRIFNVQSCDRPVKLLKKSDQRNLCNIYKEGNTAPINHAIDLLKACSETDEVMVERTWILITLATILCPCTQNMINLEYMASLEDMASVHEFAWDEQFLEATMEEVVVFQDKKQI